MRCASPGFEGKVHRALRIFIFRSPAASSKHFASCSASFLISSLVISTPSKLQLIATFLCFVSSRPLYIPSIINERRSFSCLSWELYLKICFPPQKARLSDEASFDEIVKKVGSENIRSIYSSTRMGMTTILYDDPDGPKDFCPGCRGYVHLEDDFCGHCGAPLRETVCPSCGHHVRTGMKFCTKCGKDLVQKK